MDKTKAIDLIFVEWAASLKSRDRSSKSIQPNFEDLFQRWKNIDCSFNELYDVYLPKAIKAHQPTAAQSRAVFKSLKIKVKSFNKAEKEFFDEWCQSISDTATSTFFEFFPLPIVDAEDNEPKVFGNMSAKEYKAQRRYAEQFPILDTTELEKRLKEQQYNLDLDDLLKHVLGEQK